MPHYGGSLDRDRGIPIAILQHTSQHFKKVNFKTLLNIEITFKVYKIEEDT